MGRPTYSSLLLFFNCLFFKQLDLWKVFPLGLLIAMDFEQLYEISNLFSNLQWLVAQVTSKIGLLIGLILHAWAHLIFEEFFQNLKLDFFFSSLQWSGTHYGRALNLPWTSIFLLQFSWLHFPLFPFRFLFSFLFEFLGHQVLLPSLS